MGKFIDFVAVNADFTMKDAIAMLELEGRWKGDQWRGACPVHGGDRGLVISPNQGDHGAFNCNKHGKGGWDAISLVAHVMECRQYAAAEAIPSPDMSGQWLTVPEAVTDDSAKAAGAILVKAGRVNRTVASLGHVDKCLNHSLAETISMNPR